MNRLQYFMDKVLGEPNSGCWLWMGSLNSGGYGNFWDAGKCVKAHRYAYTAFVGPIPEGLDVMHKCDTPASVNPDHLRPGTTLENIRDAWRKGRMNDRRGQRNGRALVTDFGAARIRDMASLGYQTRAIAEQFRVSTSQVRRIIRGERKEVLRHD